MHAPARIANPFKPTFGRVPLCMAGREDILDEVSEALEFDPESPVLTSLVVGARGTGKTALLACVANTAERCGWIPVNVFAAHGMLEDIYERTAEGARHLIDASTDARIVGITIGQLFGLEWTRSDEAAGNWRTRMNALFEQLDAHGVGLLITIDEVRADLPEMIEFSAVYQQFIREGKKVAVFMAGLPSQANALLNDKSVSFLRRAERFDLGRISDQAVREAFVKTAVAGGKAIAEDALDAMVVGAGGYAYMIQLIGYHAWRLAAGSELISLEHAEGGVVAAQRQLAAKVYDVAMHDLSKKDISFLTALAHLPEGSALADVASSMGVSTSYASNYRGRLERQGLIGETLEKKIRFELPGLRDYMVVTFPE